MTDETANDPEQPNLPERAIDWPTRFRDLLGQDPPEGLLMLFQQTVRRGPLPDPETLRAYRDIDPNLLNTILAEFQAEAAHRRTLERARQDLTKFDVEQSHQQARWGLSVAGIVAVAGFATAGLLGAVGETVAASVVGVLDIGYIVGVFVWGSRRNGKPPHESGAEAERDRTGEPEGLSAESA